MGLNHNTPLEKYNVKGTDVWVKRDDLHNGDLDLPPWAKIEGVRRLLTWKELIDRNSEWPESDWLEKPVYFEPKEEGV